MRVTRFLAILLLIAPMLARAQGSQFQSVATTIGYVSGTAVMKPVTTGFVRICAVQPDGSCALAAIYNDVALTQPATNPILLDKYGNFGFWAAPGSYKYSICTSPSSCNTFSTYLSNIGTASVVTSTGASGDFSALSFQRVLQADKFGGGTDDILVRGMKAWQSCGQTISEVPNTCYVKFPPPPTGQACWVATGTMTVTPMPNIAPVFDFTGTKICHSGANGVIDMSGASGAPGVAPFILGLNVVVTGTEPFVLKTAAWANMTVRDWTIKTYPINDGNSMTGVWLLGGNQFLLQNLNITGVKYPVRLEQGSDGFGPNAVTMDTLTLTPTSTGTSIYAPYAGAGDIITNSTFQGTCASPCTAPQVAYFDRAIGLDFDKNYVEVGALVANTAHPIVIGMNSQGVTVEHSNFADSGNLADIQDSGRGTLIFDNKVVGNSPHFVDFGNDIPVAFSQPMLMMNKIGLGTMVGNVPAGLIYGSIFNRITNGGPLDETHSGYIGMSIYNRGIHINSIESPSSGTKIQGLPGSGAFVCIADDTHLYRSSTACQ